jgi:hypothetical protein
MLAGFLHRYNRNCGNAIILQASRPAPRNKRETTLTGEETDRYFNGLIVSDLTILRACESLPQFQYELLVWTRDLPVRKLCPDLITNGADSNTNTTKANALSGSCKQMQLCLPHPASCMIELSVNYLPGSEISLHTATVYGSFQIPTCVFPISIRIS